MMAQYFEVLSHSDANVEQTGQFFNGSQENEPTQIRYILADDAQQFPTPQLVHLSTDQVMVVDGTQQSIQGVVIDQSQIAYQPSNQPQFSAVVQNANVHMNNQQIYYMETSSTPTEAVQAVQAVIDQASTIQQNSQSPTQPVNEQISTTNPNLDGTRTVQSNERPLLQVRTGIRPNHNPVSVSTRPVLNTIRPSVSQVRSQMRTVTPQQAQMRIRVPGPQVRQHGQVQQLRSGINPPQKSQMASMLNRQQNILQQQKQIQPAQVVQQPQVMQQQQEAQQRTDPQQVSSELQKNLTFPRQLPAKSEEQNEMEEHMDTSNPMTPYRKSADTRPPILKNPILSRLPSNIRITQTTNNQQQSPSVQTINQVLNQVHQQVQPIGQTNQNVILNDNMKKRPLPRPVKSPTVANKARIQRLPAQNFTAPRMPAPQQTPPRFPVSQQSRYPNQQTMIAQKVPQQQPVNQAAPSQPQQTVQQHPAHQNGESQINYLITPPTPNRPRQQRALPSYIPSSQIQQIIESTPIAEEFSDSIRMLVLLENGEQRLITFTLPREACTIQEVLEQVSVPFTSETNIRVTEANTNGINYIVTVGNVSNFRHGTEDDQDKSETDSSQPNEGSVQQAVSEPPKPPTPEPPKELPKLIPGKLAVCSYCGYTGEDFNKCTRCSRKLPENVRSIDAPVKISLFKNTSQEGTKEFTSQGSSTAKTTSQPSAGKPSASPKKKNVKAKPIEESVVISSDEEEEDRKTVNKSVSEHLLRNLGASVTISPVTKEPSLTEVKKHVRRISGDSSKYVKITLKCRTVRIGSYRFYPAEDVVIDSKSVVIKAPVVDSKTEIKTVRIDKGDIVKVLVCFNKSLPVVFYYLNVNAAPIICDTLNLSKESGLFYDPAEEKEDSYRKVTLLPEDLTDDHKFAFQQIYTTASSNIMDELSSKEANDILIKTCPKDGPSSAGFMSFSEIKQILLYPKEGQGRLSINTEDYVCLAIDQFLNDKIIDFYLKYLWENLPVTQQEKVHVFSTFFYKRLTTKPTKAARKSHPFEVDPTLTAAEKRHCRVKNWTKKINLFEKDYIIVPINENAHWFLAIICFPGMIGAQTFDGKLYNPEPKPTKAKKTKKEKPVPCDELMLSDKDEAESEDSDLESDDSEGSATAAASGATATVNIPIVAPPITVSPPTRAKKEVRPPIKQPCVLIFDSLAGPSRSRVVATLRDYLTVEYKTKMDSERIFNRDVIKGASVKVPQQTNFTDCGLYLLQYVEQFFKDPIKDFYIPIKGVESWFEEITVTKKREDISNLLKRLMEESGTETKILPDIALPTLNGKLIEKQEPENDGEQDNGEENQEDMFTDIDESEMINASMNSVTSTENGDANSENGQGSLSEDSAKDIIPSSQERPSMDSVSDKTEITSTVMPQMKPSLSEFPRQTNKDTLSYLKAKRIIRHKAVGDAPESKKTKLDV